MSGRIPESVLEDILGRVNIVEVISGYIPLKRAGRNFKATCPFHHEKTASFMVSPDKQIYHCFGCGESGNAFKFLMKYERLEFPEAVELLAKKAGVNLPIQERIDPKNTGLNTQLYRVNELASLFYESIISSNQGTKAKDYLIKRGLKPETLKIFKIGYATDSWDNLINHLRAKGVNLSLIEKAGLILPKDKGGYYDRFRSRIIFPILDIKSRVLGFGGRVLDGTLPKYVNSPETRIYIKGRNLYGLNLAKDHIREKDFSVIVEGYMDLIMPYQEGLRNIVASLGTALTSEQVRLLKRYTQNIYMVFDSDSAGETAAVRSLDIFVEEGMNVKIVSLPVGFDPDTYVRKHGIESFYNLINNASDIFDFKIAVLSKQYSPKEANGKAKICFYMLETINKVENAVIKSEYIKRLSQYLEIDEEAVRYELKKTREIKASLPGVMQTTARKLFVEISPTEKLLIKLMLEEAELVNRIKDRLEPADFQNKQASEIVSILFDCASQGKNIETRLLIDHLGDEDVSKFLCESVFLPEDSKEEHRDKIVEDCIQRLKNEKIKIKRLQLHEEIKQAQHSGDEERLSRLIEEFHYLIKKK